jgi:hypothetical protein
MVASASPFRSFRMLRLVAVLMAASQFAPAQNPIPQVVGPPVPQAVAPGSKAFTLKVYGANFVQGAVVNWNRSPRTTTFVSARELHATILATDVVKPTAGYITVTNPKPGGGVSSSSRGLVEVHVPTKTIAVSKPNNYLRSGESQFLVTTDFNNDGVLDFAALGVTVLLGDGDGRFHFGSKAPGEYQGVSAIAYGDFNNDGNEDLVFGANPQGPPYYLQVDLGQGGGKFKLGAKFGRFKNAYPLAIAVADFNRDGNLDLITNPSEYNRELGEFLGNGDGTFKHSMDYQVGSFYVVAADFNGDGILDLGILWDHAVYVMLGKGDGTFEKARMVIQSNKQIGTCSFESSFFVTDFNADGKADLAYCERDYPQNQGKIWIALGNGDGTFQKPSSLIVRPYAGAFSFAVGDFNSDGRTDLLANYFTTDKSDHSETDFFSGNGDGTFQSKKIINQPGQPYNAELGIVPADYNSDGLLDFIFQQPGDVAVFVQK